MSRYSEASSLYFEPTDFFSEYLIVNVEKKLCGRMQCNESYKNASKILGEHISIFPDKFETPFSKISGHDYRIIYYPAVYEAIELFPQSLQCLYRMNSKKADADVLEIIKKVNNSLIGVKRLEIINHDTLLFRSGCWVYTLKRIK
jgi:hypothetical protein